MSKGVFVALSGAVVQETALEATAQNVANASTPGYQRLRPVFKQALASAVNGDKKLRYVEVDRTAVDTAPGAVRTTGRPLDVAPAPGNFLVVQTPRGDRYTRAGALSVDADGQLRAAGMPVLNEAGQSIKVDPKGGQAVRIGTDGTVRQGTQVAGRIKLVKFERPDAVQPEGHGLVGAGGAGDPQPSKEPVSVGAVEESNAEPVSAMTEMMSASRTFEAFQRVLDAFNEVDRKLVTTVPGAFE
jgi:flagellar basal-body rod protein FlgF